METLAVIFTILTLFLHAYFCVLEMFFWTKPLGLKVFHMSADKANASSVLAANQGLYNGMLALGLLVSFFLHDSMMALSIRLYCLGFIIVVGCYGSYSLKSSKVWFIQALPAMLALILTLLSVK